MQYDNLGAGAGTADSNPRGAVTPAMEFAFGVDLLVSGLQLG